MKFAKTGKQPDQVFTIHQIDCHNDNVIVGSEIAGWRVHKFILHPKTESARLQKSESK